jgi:hypothetical protein
MVDRLVAVWLATAGPPTPQRTSQPQLPRRAISAIIASRGAARARVRAGPITSSYIVHTHIRTVYIAFTPRSQHAQTDGGACSEGRPRRLDDKHFLATAAKPPRLALPHALDGASQDAATSLHHQAVAPRPLQAPRRRLFLVSPPHAPPGQPEAQHGARKARPDAAGDRPQGARRRPSSPRESDTDGLTRAAGQEPRCKGPQRHLGPGE